jgi:acyl-CoA synthetase (AMP-forming)/AMP-acid ligase II
MEVFPGGTTKGVSWALHDEFFYERAQRLTSWEAARRNFATSIDLLPVDGTALRAVVDDDRRRPLSFTRLQAFADMLDMRQFGILRGDRLCLCLPNMPEAAAAFLACAMSCAVAPLNPELNAAEFAFELAALPATALIVHHGMQPDATVIEVFQRMRVPIIALTPSSETVGEFTLGWWEGAPAATAHRHDRDERGGVPAVRTDTALMLHTSGVTRQPRLVPLLHEHVAVGGLCVASCVQLHGRRSATLNVMPLHSLRSICVGLLAALLCGSSVACAPSTDEHASRLLLRWLGTAHTPRWLAATPAILGALERTATAMALPRIELQHTLCFVRSEGCALPVRLGMALEERFRAPVATAYASTEAMAISANHADGSRKLTSVGFGAGVEMRLCDDEGRQVPRGAQGEVCVRGACVTLGYVVPPHAPSDPNKRAFHPEASPERTTADADDGASVRTVRTSPRRAWLRTGDRGRVDDDGHLQLIGTPP